MKTIATLYQQYSETKNENLLYEIFLQVVGITRAWVKTNNLYREHELPEEFISEVALEFLVRLRSQQMYIPKNFVYYIYEMCRASARKHVARHILGETDERWSDNPIDKLIDREKLQALTKDTTDKVRSLVIHYYIYRDIEILRNVRGLLTKTEYLDLSKRVFSMTDETTKSKHTFEENLPTTPIGQAMFFSMLMDRYPEVASFLVFLKDYRKFFQFLSLFEGMTIKIPNVQDVVEDLVEVSRSLERLEKGRSLMTDLDVLRRFIIDSRPDLRVEDRLVTFVTTVFDLILKRYTDATEVTIDKLSGMSAKELAEVYEMFNKNFAAQVNLLQAVSEISHGRISEIFEGIREHQGTKPGNTKDN